MADNEDKKNDGSDEKAEKSKSDNAMSIKKLIIIMSSIFIVIMVLTIAGVVLVFKSSNSEETQVVDGNNTEQVDELNNDNNENVVEEKSSSKKGKAVFYSIRPVFVVNFQKSKRAKYLQISVDLMTRNEDVVDDVIDNLPLIKNDLITLFSSQKQEELTDIKGKEKLRKEALLVVQKVLKQETGRSGVEEVLFTSFTMQ